jgi:hypothetical protein
MDLIYTDENRIEQGILSAYQLDLSFGQDENNFELTIDKDKPLALGAFIYIDGTEYGGIIDGAKTSTESRTVTYFGRTWHGILDSKIIVPPVGSDYLTVSGDANTVLEDLIYELGLVSLFVVSPEEAGKSIDNYQFDRYVKAYDAITKMLYSNALKLKFLWDNGNVMLSTEPYGSYSDDIWLDEYSGNLSVEKHKNKVNHLICLGGGELANRTVIHLYSGEYGGVYETPYYTGTDEITEVFDYPNAKGADDLREQGEKHFLELMDVDAFDVSATEYAENIYDLGDFVPAYEKTLGFSKIGYVIQKIIRINNGVTKIEYQLGDRLYG